MASWAEKRKFLYAFIAIFIFIAVVGIPIFLIVYKIPSCSDGKINGSEKGVDCGGKCPRLCQSAFLAPVVAWSRFEKVVPGVYNVGTYIINPNIEGEAKDVPYHISLFDSQGMLITDQKGMVTLPPRRNTLAFDTSVRVGQSIPSKVLFEFTSKPDWFKKIDRLSSVEIVGKEYVEEGNSSLLRVSLQNQGLSVIGRLAVYAILYDKDGNVVGFSKTYIDEIKPFAIATAPFTWNTNRQGTVVSIEVLYVSE